LKNPTCVLTRENESPLAVLCLTRPWVRGFILATLFGTLTALAAQMSIRLPFTPVPVTGQVFLVLLAGGLLGPRLGAISQLEYLALGALGLPVFAAGSGGPLVFIGPTAGYLLGFVAAAWVVGRLAHTRRQWWRLLFANLCGLSIIYFLGCIWLAGWLVLSKAEGLGIHQPAGAPFLQALLLGAMPFLWVDLAKVLLATQIVHSLRGRAGAACAVQRNDLE